MRQLSLTLMVPVLLAATSLHAAESYPIALHPENPHYFLWRGKPTILITSGEHYGAVLNRAFDCQPYLATLQSHGFNLTRTFSGAYCEPVGAFKIEKNTLAPAQGDLLCPWTRSDTPGYANGGNKFDLTQWDPAYFQRLAEFVGETGKRGIVVELVLFCPFYEDSMWELSPMNARNNVNGVGGIQRTDVYTLKNGNLLAVQDAMVQRIVEALKNFDNVYYEICNEPYFGGVTEEWQSHIAQTVVKAESGFKKRHLIAQNIANKSQKIENPNPNVSIFNFHYAKPPIAVAENYSLNRVIADDETGFAGEDRVKPYRLEAWDFLVAGGAAYSNLDYSFTVANVQGDARINAPGGGGPELRKQLQILKEFIEGFDFIRMKPDDTVVQSKLPKGITARVLCEQGKAYAVYVNGNDLTELVLDLSAGEYRAEWVNTKTGQAEKTESFKHDGGSYTSQPPRYVDDIALRVRAAGDANGRLGLHLPAGKPEVFERVEISVTGMPAAANPFDPESIALDLEVTPPSGPRLRVPGYFQQEFDRKLEGNREVLTPSGEGSWRLRWLPLEAGRHTLVATVTLAGKAAAQGEAVVEVAAGKRHGLARLEPDGKRYFRLDDGAPLFLNGLCACWHGRRGTYDYDDWLEAYQKAGINYIRIWMWHQAFGIEWDKGDKVHYRLDNAWRLDRVLAEAERRGVFVMLCLDYHGIFEVKPDYWGTNNFWPRHPYNAANGGPCQTQNDFFKSEEAKKLYAKRLRYLVARWSAFPNLLAWEFFNEIDNEYSYLKHDDVVAWHREMGRQLRSIDPCRHLISSSFTGGSVRPDLFALPEMDFAQYHSYNEKHPAQMTAEKTARFFEKYQKPFFVSEYGTDWKGWKPDTDPHFRALHQAIWSGVFTGAAGTDMTWWWESIHTAKLYSHWSALSRFLEGTGIGRADLRPARFESVEGTVTPFGVAAREEALVWLLDRTYDWPDGAMNADPSPASGMKVTLTGLSDGVWSVEWWDTLAGKSLATGVATVSGGVLPLAPPAFQVDIAARLRKR